VLAHLAECSIEKAVEVIALPDSFVPHGKVSELYKELGLDAKQIYKRILSKPIKVN
jgi:deoxyxylulose-5-phosphate synthase